MFHIKKDTQHQVKFTRLAVGIQCKHLFIDLLGYDIKMHGSVIGLHYTDLV